jgi:predicted acyltransferase
MLQTNRLVSLDAFRGFIMLLMASSGFGLAQMAKANPDSWWWQQIGWQVGHAPWGYGPQWQTWGALWDMIQPAFMFMVGVAVPYSLARRKEAGEGLFRRLWHAFTRSILLILLGVLLATRSSSTQTVWLFTNVLAQIGLGYLFLHIIASFGWEYCVAALIVIVVGYWYYFLQHPLPGPGFDFASVGAVPSDLIPGHFGHWSKHLNAAAAFDRWFLNLFPRETPYVTNEGGYTTLNFIPSLATMLGGAVTGHFLRTSPKSHGQRCGMLIVIGLVCLLIGVIMGLFAMPIVKRIWTPSWVFFSGGWVLLMLAFFYWLVEMAGQRKLVFPLVVVGMNSIFIYLLHNLTSGWIMRQVRIHAGQELFATEWAPVIERCGMLFILWLLCFWLYRQRAFLRL